MAKRLHSSCENLKATMQKSRVHEYTASGVAKMLTMVTEYVQKYASKDISEDSDKDDDDDDDMSSVGSYESGDDEAAGNMDDI